MFQDTVDDLNNNRKNYYYLIKPNAVVIIGYTKDKILFLKVKRYLTRRLRYELPGGRMEKGETPIRAAKREFKEETGLTSTNWAFIGSTYSLPSITTEQVYMFSAEITDVSTIKIDNKAKTEGIVNYKLFDFQHVCQIISKNRVSSPIDGFAFQLFIQKHLRSSGGLSK